MAVLKATPKLGYKFLYWQNEQIADTSSVYRLTVTGNASFQALFYSTSAKARKIFRNANMTEENWQRIEQMLNKIIDDCMGGMLYNAINQKLQQYNIDGIDIGFESTWGNRAYWEVRANNQFVLTMGNEAGSDLLIHEMSHTMQTLNQTNNHSSNLNSELEAYLVQHRYLKNLWGEKSPEYGRYLRTPRGKSMEQLDSYLDSNGQLYIDHYDPDDYFWNELNFLDAIDSSVSTLRQHPMYEDELKYPYDSSKRGMDNFQNLTQLSAGC